MTTLRSHALLEHDAASTWAVVRDVVAVARWFPAMVASEGDRHRRRVTLGDGSVLEEEIVTLDDRARRLQYRVVGGDLPVDAHLGTVDVLELDGSRCVLVYSTEIEPPELAGAFHAAIDEAVQHLGVHLRG